MERYRSLYIVSTNLTLLSTVALLSRETALRKANRNNTRDNRIYIRRHRGQPCRDVHVGKHLRFNGLEQQTILYVGDLPQSIAKLSSTVNATYAIEMHRIARLILLARMSNVHCHTMTAHHLFHQSGSTFVEQRYPCSTISKLIFSN